ncbi:aminodeoxychorismate synthase component I [Microbacterium pygmaeum]|uniref:Anthranilate synthase component 1 n=1 Tax=Microbacterium pygmaeum TaxID=370764 RepID=A0A1G8AR95_9MICO|nr:aminodeoxychorismate synthase component I [Microbacterium pygmaeum]SDH23495.1 anthranilate synthase component 1 [Microbacterium pygmaeum]
MPLIAEPVERWLDPASVFAALAADHADVFWLDAGPDAAAGWSWVGVGTVEVSAGVRGVRTGAAAADDDRGWEAGPFRGGWVGWSGYEVGAARAGAPTAETEDEPALERWLRVEEFAAFDHAARRVWIIAPATRHRAFTASIVTGAESAPFRDPDPIDPPPVHLEVTARHSAEEYAALIERCREAIRDGDAYQLCLTTRFGTGASIDPLRAHERLRATTPAHHGGLLRTGDLALISASPEQFLTVTGGTVRTKPIKGTRPRGEDPAADAEQAAQLLGSEKERAENVMIVDLMRNDLSRVCEPGSVGVDRLLEIESYPAVHQLVSTVSGLLRPGTTVGDLLDVTFPAGSMTGAPKLSAMTILHDLERGPRGIFAGCFGWVGSNGDLDLAMVIRSIVTHPGGTYVGAGGGITWRSDAAAEVAEVAIKAQGPLAAIGATLPPDWR